MSERRDKTDRYNAHRDEIYQIIPEGAITYPDLFNLAIDSMPEKQDYATKVGARNIVDFLKTAFFRSEQHGDYILSVQVNPKNRDPFNVICFTKKAINAIAASGTIMELCRSINSQEQIKPKVAENFFLLREQLIKNF